MKDNVLTQKMDKMNSFHDEREGYESKLLLTEQTAGYTMDILLVTN